MYIYMYVCKRFEISEVFKVSLSVVLTILQQSFLFLCGESWKSDGPSGKLPSVYRAATPELAVLWFICLCRLVLQEGDCG